MASPCNRCGFCCLAMLCPIAERVLGGPKHRPCPALGWDGNTAVCGLLESVDPARRDDAEREFGIGTGCDTTATLLRSTDGIAVDFTSLPDDAKVQIVRAIREGSIPLHHRRNR